MTADKDILRGDRAALVEALAQAGTVFRGNACRCPFHEDRHASAGVYVKDNTWRFHCHVCNWGGDIFDVQAKLNKTTAADELKKLAEPKPQTPPRQNPPTFASLDAVRAYLTAKAGLIETEHIYTGIDGDVVQTVFRCRRAEGKTFRPFHLTDKGYALGAAPKPWSLYGLPVIVKAESVIVVEGEKCADVLTRYGFAATTSAGGAKNARNTDWQALSGKAVILWPDNDAEGRRYVADVESILQGLHPAPRISIIDPAALDLAEREDVADFVAQLKVVGKTDAEITTAIAEAIKTAKLLSIAGEVRQRFADIRAGLYLAIAWPWALIHSLTHALLPGTVTLIVGSAGATKSFMALQAFAFWLIMGLKVALFEAEEDRCYHLTRALAQRAACANVTDTEWVHDNPDEAARLTDQHGAFLDAFGRVIHAMPEAQPTLTQLAAWVETQAKSGCRIIGIDPVTVAARTGDVWAADTAFLQALKLTAREYGCSILLVTHPIKHVLYPDLTQLAGAAAYQRFTQTILWLESHEPKVSHVRAACGTAETEHNRTLHIIKARNGIGMGKKLALQFHNESLTLSELGIIVKKHKGTQNE